MAVESGEIASLQATAVKAGVVEMNQSIHDKLTTLNADYATGVAEAAARREVDLLAAMEKQANAPAEKREKQQAQFAPHRFQLFAGTTQLRFSPPHESHKPYRAGSS